MKYMRTTKAHRFRSNDCSNLTMRSHKPRLRSHSTAQQGEPRKSSIHHDTRRCSKAKRGRNLIIEGQI